MSDPRKKIRPVTPPSLLVAAHCATIRRRNKRLDTQELSAMLNDLVRELNLSRARPTTFYNSLNEVVQMLNSTLPPALLSISSHYFLVLVRNTVRDLLDQLSSTRQLDLMEICVLRNCILLLEHFVAKVTDISKLLHWIMEISFLEAFANCVTQVQAISQADENKRYLKQLARLLSMFADIQERLPADLHQSLFTRLLQPTINCLTSPTYQKLFRNLKANATSLTPQEKFYLVKCPYFLTSYNGPHIGNAIERVLELMLPRYTTLLDRHMKTIKRWNRPMMRAVHHLLTTMIFAEGSFNRYLIPRSLRALIDHLLHLISEPTFIQKVLPLPTNLESILVNAALTILSVLVYEPDALEHLKRCRSARYFRPLLSTSSESIVLNAYMMLAYTMDDEDLRESQGDLSQLFRTTLGLLQDNRPKNQPTSVEEKPNRNTVQLIETLRGLIQHEKIQDEITTQNALPFLMQLTSDCQGLAKQLLLECLWTLSFHGPFAQVLRENSALLLALQSIPPPTAAQTQSNTIRRSNSFSTRRTSGTSTANETINDGSYQMANGLLWQLNKASQAPDTGENKSQGSTYDIMISYALEDKDIAQKIHDFLASIGFRLCFNQDPNQARTMETISSSITHSAIVILCLSDSYRRDNQCRVEAEIGVHSKRFLLPVLVRKGYKVYGWLNSLVNKNPLINFATTDFPSASAMLVREIPSQYRMNVVAPQPRTMTPVTVETNLSNGLDRRSQEKTPVPPRSRQTTPDRPPQPPARPRSREPSPMVSVASTPSTRNSTVQARLPEEYMRRDTEDSRYRSIPINSWGQKDILDFFHDANLHAMMPLCESMTGQGLIQVFRMCQSKPSRLYRQLNHELRVRFKGYTLPMGIYTQFLIEMEGLIGPAADAYPTLLPMAVPHSNGHRGQMPNGNERLISVVQASPVSSIGSGISPSRSKLLTPIDPASGSTTPQLMRVIERAVFRPASSVGRPYDFIIESIEEPTVVLKQVERFGSQLLLLDEEAHEHRQRNRSR